MKQFSLVSALLLCAVISQAQTSATDTVNMDTISVTAPAAPPKYQATAARQWDIKHTRIALSFNWKERTADVREWIKIRPWLYAIDSLILDAKSMKIDSIVVTSKKVAVPETHIYTGEQLKLFFRQQFKMNDTLEIYLKYTAMPYAESTGGSSAISDDRGLYFINTDYSTPNKPAQIWTQGETESNSHWMITLDKPNVRFTTQIELTVPDSFTTLSNGALLKQVKGKPGMRTDIWAMDKPIQAYVAMFAIGKYSVVRNKWRGRDVNYYVEAPYERYAKLMFNNTPEMMDFFSAKTGVTYPWNKYDQVVVRDYVSGAMENTTATLWGEFVNQDDREIADNNYEDVTAHELFHMWFGDYATAESWSNVTVNESFANYGEQMWRTHKYGKAYGDELAWSDLNIYIQASAASDPDLVRFYYDSREELFDRISYNKGGAILRYMNNLMGDYAFEQSMKLYLTRNALHAAEAHDWRMAVEEVTGQDWNWFFNEWYYHGGHPMLKVVYNYDDVKQKLVVAVSQTQSDSAMNYDLPLKAALVYGDDKKVIDWRITKRRDTFTYDYRGGQKPVLIPDYDHVLPGEMKDGKKPAQWLAQYRHSGDYIGRRLAVQAAGRVMSDSSSQAILDLAFTDTLRSIRRYALAQLENAQSDKYHKRWKAKVMDMAVNDKDNLVRAQALDVLGKWKEADAKAIMLKALDARSYAEAGSALEAISSLDEDTAYALAKRILLTKPRGSLESSIWTLMGRKGADEDAAFFERQAVLIYGQKRFQFVFALINYAKNVKSDESYNTAMRTFVVLNKTEGLKSYRGFLHGFMAQVVSQQHDKLKSQNADEAAMARKRFDMALKAIKQMSADEPDADERKDVDKMIAKFAE